jgi:hypothetical protein
MQCWWRRVNLVKELGRLNLTGKVIKWSIDWPEQ